MIVVMKSDATMTDISSVVKVLESMGYKPHPTRGADRTIIGVVDARQGADFSQIESAPGVEQVVPITKAYKMVSREFQPQNTIVNVERCRGRRHELRGDGGPVRGREPRAGARPRRARSATAGATHPARRRVQAAHLALQLPGPGRGGAANSAGRGKRETGLPIVTEVMDAEQVAAGRASTPTCLQIGARNMQNFALLEAVGADAQAGAAQARHVVHDRRIADGRGVRPLERQPARHPVRARHPHLRERHPQHARHLRRARHQAQLTPAHHRRPQPCRGAHASS